MDYQFLENTLLFQGISANEIESLLGCLKSYVKSFKKGAVIYQAGDVTEKAGVVLKGSVHMEKDDLWGNRTLLARAKAGEMFAENYACMPEEPMMVRVTAAEDSEILFLDLGQGLQTCAKNCPVHHRLLRNLFRISAQKSLTLSRRIFYTTSKTIRGRLLAYLSDMAIYSGSLTFDIPFNRQQLADYLGVERSAMSKELGKLQKEGLLTSSKYHFSLNKNVLEIYALK